MTLASPLELRLAVACDDVKTIILAIVRIFFRISVELQWVSHNFTILFPAKANFSFESNSIEFTVMIVHS